jgi:hypothetical protein
MCHNAYGFIVSLFESRILRISQIQLISLKLKIAQASKKLQLEVWGWPAAKDFFLSTP